MPAPSGYLLSRSTEPAVSLSADRPGPAAEIDHLISWAYGGRLDRPKSWRRLAAGEASCTSGRSTICATDSSSCVLAQKSGGTTADIRWHGARADGMQLAITDIQSWARVEQEDPLEGDRPLRGNEPQTKKGGHQPRCRCGFQERQ
jgi:hypothetical protein